MDIFFKSSQDLVESVISAHSVNMSLWYWVMWISFHMLLLPSVQRQRTCLREKIQNLTSTKLLLWPSCFNYTAELKKAGKYKTTKGYHHVKHCWDIHNPTTLWACWVGSEPPEKVTAMLEMMFGRSYRQKCWIICWLDTLGSTFSWWWQESQKSGHLLHLSLMKKTLWVQLNSQS